MTLHLNDDGCLCETCTKSGEGGGCPTFAYVVLAQKRAKKSAPLELEPEATLRMHIAECAGYVRKRKLGDCPLYYRSLLCCSLSDAPPYDCFGELLRCFHPGIKIVYNKGREAGEQEFIDSPDPAVLSDLCDQRR